MKTHGINKMSRIDGNQWNSMKLNKAQWIWKKINEVIKHNINDVINVLIHESSMQNSETNEHQWSSMNSNDQLWKA